MPMKNRVPASPLPGERELVRKLGEDAVVTIQTLGYVWGWRVRSELTGRYDCLYAQCGECNRKWEKTVDLERVTSEQRELLKRSHEEDFLRFIRRECPHIPAPKD
jgi:hypothetical protein